ncbi:unnamed protein product, partial [Hymenolepis diminuta]
MIEFREDQNYNWKSSKDTYSSYSYKNTVEPSLPINNLRIQGHHHSQSNHNQGHQHHLQNHLQQQNPSQQKGSLQLWRFL